MPVPTHPSPLCRHCRPPHAAPLCVPSSLDALDGHLRPMEASKAKEPKLGAAGDRPRIYMSNKTHKVVVVFPNGEVVEGECPTNDVVLTSSPPVSARGDNCMK